MTGMSLGTLPEGHFGLVPYVFYDALGTAFSY